MKQEGIVELLLWNQTAIIENGPAFALRFSHMFALAGKCDSIPLFAVQLDSCQKHITVEEWRLGKGQLEALVCDFVSLCKGLLAEVNMGDHVPMANLHIQGTSRAELYYPVRLLVEDFLCCNAVFRVDSLRVLRSDLLSCARSLRVLLRR